MVANADDFLRWSQTREQLTDSCIPTYALLKSKVPECQFGGPAGNSASAAHSD